MLTTTLKIALTISATALTLCVILLYGPLTALVAGYALGALVSHVWL